MHLLLVFTNNSFIIFYTLYLINMFYFPKYGTCVSHNINRNYITKPVPVIPPKNNTRTLLTINSDFLNLKPVQLSVNTFWGEDSQFNSRILLQADLKHTCSDVKKLVSRKTGIPVELQNLYVCRSSDFKDCVKFKESDPLSSHLRDFKVSPSKELELNLLLDLPAPLYVTVKPDLSRFGEYLAALTRYTDLLNNLTDPDSFKDSGYKNNINSFINESSKIKINSPPGVLKHEESLKEQSTQTNASGLNRKRRIYIRLFEDFPPDSPLFKDRFSGLLKDYFPINLVGTLKFAAFCLLLRANGNHSPLASTSLALLPLVAVAAQTKPGILLYRTLFHFLSRHYIPKIIYNVLPAHIAEKFNKG